MTKDIENKSSSGMFDSFWVDAQSFFFSFHFIFSELQQNLILTNIYRY